MPVNSVIVLYRPKNIKYGMYKCEEPGKAELDFEESYKYNGVHRHMCDNCLRSICGERWACEECPIDSVDLCADCYYSKLRVETEPNSIRMGCKHDMSHFMRMNLKNPPQKPEKKFNSSGAMVKRGNGSGSGGMTQLRSDEIWYCGRHVRGNHQCRCGACDERCGPSNGCPCESCLKLLNIPKRNSAGHEVNTGNGTHGGHTGLRSDKVWYCGRIVRDANACRCRSCDERCGPGNGCPCESCFELLHVSPVSRNNASRCGTRCAEEQDDGETRGAGSQSVSRVSQKPPDLGKCIEDGFKHVELLDFYVDGQQDNAIVTKHEAVSAVFCENVKKRLRKGDKCPITSGHVRIPFGITISGMIPKGGVTLAAKPIGRGLSVLTCHMLHMRESLFMEYLDVYNGIPEIIRSKRIANKFELLPNIWNMETHTDDIYTLQHFTEATTITPDDEDVRKLVKKASNLMKYTQEKAMIEGSSQDDVDDIRVVVKHDVKSMFKAGTDVIHFSTMTAEYPLFPHVPGYDIAAIIPVTLQVQVVSGSCDICTRPARYMQILCPNKHEMCDDCIENWTSKGVHSCPFCRAPMFDCHFGRTMHSSSMEFDRAVALPEPFNFNKFIV